MPSDHAAPSRRRWLLRLITPAALLLGYADLVRGGMTASAILLVVAYVVLVPMLVLEG